MREMKEVEGEESNKKEEKIGIQLIINGIDKARDGRAKRI